MHSSPDLARYDYLPETVPQGVELLTVGWLEPGRDFRWKYTYDYYTLAKDKNAKGL